MAQRTPVDFNLGGERIQPVASPVDTFSRTDAGRSLSQLAESLKEIAPEVAKYSDVVAQQQSETQKASGEQKAREMAESGISYKDAIKKGLISPQESPWFQLGAKEQYGRVTAGRYSTDLQNAVDQNPQLQESTDVAQYDKFVSDFRKQWMDTNVGDENRGLSFEHGFGSMADAYSEDSRRQFVAQAGQRLVKQVGDGHYQEVFTLLDHELSLHTNPDAIAQGIDLLSDRAIAMGMNGKVVNEATVKALGDIVQRDGDLTLFNILKKVKGGSADLYSTRPAQEEIQRVTDKVSADQQQKHNAARQQETEAREDASRKEVGDITSQWINAADPAQLNFDDRISALSKIDPSAADGLIRFKATITGAKFDSDPAQVNRLLASVFTYDRGQEGYVDNSTLVNSLNHHDINQRDFAFLKGMVDNRDSAIAEGTKSADARSKSIYTDPRFRDAFSALRSRFVSQYSDDPSKNILGDRAQAELIQSWLEWSDGEGKAATYEQKNKFLTGEIERITQKFGHGEVKTAADRSPTLDLRSDTQTKYDAAIIDVLEEQLRAGQFSPGIQRMLAANHLTVRDVPAFIKAQRTLNAQHQR